MAAEPRHIRVAAAVVWREGRLLFTRRPPGGPLGLLWEFPGGKLEPGETPERALTRELREELGVTARALEVLAVERHEYDHGLSVEISFVRCELDSLAFVPSPEVHEVRWALPAEVDPSEVLEGDRAFLARLAAGGAGTRG
ncbi:MAG: (deoxy)nucleoside triphosphate pyrophosphohydrolase [Candidatus Eisenbacteria bacterium]|nr:(deoxy)nucleoside triphosphate pyrophosphohydrolase [Candidatus Eisenbacteria bacterium]